MKLRDYLVEYLYESEAFSVPELERLIKKNILEELIDLAGKTKLLGYLETYKKDLNKLK